jgi:hypothetical protein
MLQRLKSAVLKRYANFHLPPQGEKGIEAHGHRKYVGGRWEEIGQLQLDMLKDQGLRPQHCLLDIACGSFRLGVKAIDYLDTGNYLGIEKEGTLVELGIEHEIGGERLQAKKPELIISADFEFQRLTKQPDFVIAQSLFTHLTPELINLCFAKLRHNMKPTTRFFATFFEAPGSAGNPRRSNDWGYFAYSRHQIIDFGVRNGYATRYIGDWKHPRNQILVEYRSAELPEGV